MNEQMRLRAEELFLDIMEDSFVLELGQRFQSLTMEQVIELEVTIAQNQGALDELALALGYRK
jgi:hypothetical protein